MEGVRLLDRYLLRELLIPLIYCFCGFMVFWIAFEFASDIDDFQRAHLKALDVGLYYWVRLPKLLVDIVAPITFLLALLYTVTQHARHNELTAMRAAGMSLWRICVPYWFVGLLLSLGCFWLNENKVPTGVDQAERILYKNEKTPAGSYSRDWIRGVTFQNNRDQRLWLIDAFNKKTFQLSRPDVEWRADDGGRKKLIAMAALHHEGDWVFDGVQLFSYSPAGALTNMVQTNRLVITNFTELPSHIRNEIRVNSRGSFKEAKRLQISIRELEEYRSLRGDSLAPKDRAWVETRLHERYSTPFTCLVVALIAVPFAAPSGRRNVYVGVASSLFIGFAYFVLKEFSLAAGTGGHIQPWVAAWLPNSFFGLLGIWLISRVR